MLQMEIRNRKSTLDLTSDEINLLVRAILALKNRTVNGESAYNRYIRIHAQVIAHVNPDHIHEQNVAHFCPAFLPWHRQFLLEFENDLRETHNDFKDVALPYWDWSRDRQGASVFTDEFMGPFNPYDEQVILGPFGSLLGKWECKFWNVLTNDYEDIASLRRAEALGPMPSPEAAEKVMRDFPVYDMSPWDGDATGGFREQIEVNLHNVVHFAVGGYMADPRRAVNDPVFFLHHANIDRLWACWQAANPGAQYVPDQPIYTDFPGQGIDQQLELLKPSTPREMWNLESTGIRYLRKAGVGYTVMGNQEFGEPGQTTANPEIWPMEVGFPPPGAAMMVTPMRGFRLAFLVEGDQQITEVGAGVVPPLQSKPNDIVSTATTFESKGKEIRYQRQVGFNVMYLQDAGGKPTKP